MLKKADAANNVTPIASYCDGTRMFTHRSYGRLRFLILLAAFFLAGLTVGAWLAGFVNVNGAAAIIACCLAIVAGLLLWRLWQG